MKKIIALLLALTLCLGLFAGCDNGEQPAASTGLADAKAYLEAMYKQESEITAVDYTRVGVVTIDGTAYPVTWTADNTAIKLTVNDKMVKVELPDTLEDIAYTLTATITDAEGKTETVTFKRTVPAAAGLPTTIEDGTYVILAGNLTMSSLTEDKAYGYPYATEVTVTDGTVSGHKKADVLTIKNVEGGVTIQDAYGRYFYLKGTYNSFNVDAAAPAEGHVWEILKNGDNYLIVNAMNKKTLAYDTGYTSWGAYPELGETHNSLLTILPATAPAEDPVDPNLPENNDPEADTTLSVSDAIALGGSKEHNTYTAGKYYVTGVITEVYNEQYGNMKITDEAGNILTIYGTFDATGENRYDAMATKPVAGDTVTIYGIIGQYNGTPQIKNGWITAHTPAGGSTEDPTEPPATEPPATEPPATEPPATEPAAPSVPATLAEQIAEANKLANKEHLSYESTITGTVTDDPKPSDYTPGTYKFTVSDGTNTLLCYFVPVTGGTPVKGSTVTVTGCLTAYNGSAQFDDTATAVLVEGGATEEPTEPDVDVTVPDVTLTEGMKVVIYAPAHGKALSSKPSSEGSYYQLGVDVALNGDTLTGWSDTEVWTVSVNADGSFSFSQGGQNLGMQDQYSSMSLGSVNDDWTLVSLGNGLYLIQNVVRGNCIEWYSSKNNWSTYTTTADAGNDLFHMAFYVVE